jgi:uncharacterized protein (TIGR02757 family)
LIKNSAPKLHNKTLVRLNRVGAFLNELQKTYHRRDLLNSDPLEFVYHFSDPFDQESVALVAALLAYGNVKQVRKSVKDVLDRMERLGGSPAQLVRRLGDREDPGYADFNRRFEKEFASFVHRFNRGKDLVLLFRLLAESWKRHGSLGGHFLTHQSTHSLDITDALSALIADWRDWSYQLFKAPKKSSFHYLLTSPADGSCCKRWCMFLRWMGRKDELDPGLWTEESGLRSSFPEGLSLHSSQLILPLDTHTGRISQYLGLTQRKTLDWKAALEITQSLGVCDPTDPTRYDFSLSRLGILDVCKRHYREEICTQCQLVTVCRFAQSGRVAMRRKVSKRK